MSELSFHVTETTLEYGEPFNREEYLQDRKSFVCTLEGSSARGLGEAAPLLGWTESREVCAETLRELTETPMNDLEEVRTLESELRDRPAARHGLNQARLDLQSRRANQALYEFLGQESIEDTIGVNTLLPDPESLRGSIGEALDSGFEYVKIKASSTPGETLREVESLPEDIQNRVKLRIDANESWSPDAVRNNADRFRSLPIDYLEQPFPRSDLQSHSACRDLVSVALDESFLEYNLSAVIRKDAADVVVVKPQVLGGLDRAVKLIDQVVETDLNAVVTTAFEGPVGRAGALQVAASKAGHLKACGLLTGRYVTNQPNWEESLLTNGFLRTPDGIGLCLPATVRNQQC